MKCSYYFTLELKERKTRKEIIDRKFPSGNTIIIQMNTLLTYKE